MNKIKKKNQIALGTLSLMPIILDKHTQEAVQYIYFALSEYSPLSIDYNVRLIKPLRYSYTRHTVHGQALS